MVGPDSVGDALQLVEELGVPQDVGGHGQRGVAVLVDRVAARGQESYVPGLDGVDVCSGGSGHVHDVELVELDSGVLKQGEVSCAHRTDGLQGLGDVVGVDVDPVLEVHLPVGGGQLPLPPEVLVEGDGDRGDDTGPGDSLGLPVHGPVLLDHLESEVDLVPVLGEDVLVEDLGDPAEVVLQVGDGSGSREHSAFDRLSLHGGSGGGGSGEDVVSYLERHLGVGSVVGDEAVLLLVEEPALVHHGKSIRTDLVPDRGGNQKLASVLDVESDVDGGERSCVPLLLLDPACLVRVLSCEREVVDGYALEQRELDRVSANAHPLDLVEVDAEGGDKFVHSVDQNLVGHLGSDIDAERQMVHDVGTRERVALGDGSRDDLAGLELDRMPPGTAGSDVQRYSIAHSFLLLSLSRKDFFSFGSAASFAFLASHSGQWHSPCSWWWPSS